MTEQTFADLGLSKLLLDKIEKKGYKKPSPIQAGVIPLLLNGEKDIIGQAQTGSGKTASFVLPILDKLDKNLKNVQALILAPTRELAIQLVEDIKSFADTHVKVQLIYGGQLYKKEIDGLRKKPQIVVGTTGRIIDHISRKKTLKVDNLKYLVLDEADEMLNMGFIEDIEQIIKYTPKEKKVLLFSATMPRGIKNVVNKYIKDHNEIKIEKKESTIPNILQTHYRVEERDKFEVLCRIIEIESNFYSIIFCKTKIGVDEISSKLLQKGYKAEGIHGDISQNLREKTLSRFKSKSINILVATDVAARGIDVQDLTHVINYNLPENPEIYTHRIGRTARAGKKGEAISLVGRKDSRILARIEKNIKTKIKLSKIPDPEKIILVKKEKLINKVNDIVNNKQNYKYLEMANELISLGEPNKILSIILEEGFGNEFSIINYKTIKTGNFDGKNQRIFVAKGKESGILNPGKLIKFIEAEIGQKLGDVGRIDIKDNFSFMTLSDQDAYITLNHFKKINSRRPMVTKAKER